MHRQKAFSIPLSDLYDLGFILKYLILQKGTVRRVPPPSISPSLHATHTHLIGLTLPCYSAQLIRRSQQSIEGSLVHRGQSGLSHIDGNLAHRRLLQLEASRLSEPGERKRGGKTAFPDSSRIFPASSFLFLHPTSPSDLVDFLNPIPRFEGFPTDKSICTSTLITQILQQRIFSRSLYPFLHCCPPFPQQQQLGVSIDPKDSLVICQRSLSLTRTSLFNYSIQDGGRRCLRYGMYSFPIQLYISIANLFICD